MHQMMHSLHHYYNDAPIFLIKQRIHFHEFEEDRRIQWHYALELFCKFHPLQPSICTRDKEINHRTYVVREQE